MKKHRNSLSANPGLHVGSKVRALILSREDHEILVKLSGGCFATISFDDLKFPKWWSKILISKETGDVIKVKIIKIDETENISVVPTEYCLQMMSVRESDLSSLEEENILNNIIKSKESRIRRIQNNLCKLPRCIVEKQLQKIQKLEQQIRQKKDELTAFQMQNRLLETSLCLCSNY